jgi:hypothetical protein
VSKQVCLLAWLSLFHSMEEFLLCLMLLSIVFFLLECLLLSDHELYLQYQQINHFA